MKRILALATASALALTLLVGCGKKGEGGTSSKSNSPSNNDTLVVYTARSESLNNAVIENFEADTGHPCGCGDRRHRRGPQARQV